MKLIILFFLFFNALPVFAEVYQQTNEAGQTTYSDIPVSQQAQPINVPPPLSPNNATISTPSPVVETTRKQYIAFSLKSPTNQQTFHNQPTIPVKIQIDPELQEGDSIQLYVDNKPFGEPSASTELQLFQLNRGTHQVYAVLLDNNKRIIKQTSSITIYIHQQSALSPVRNTNSNSGI